MNISVYLCSGFILGFISAAFLYLIDALVPFFKDFFKYLKDRDNHANS